MSEFYKMPVGPNCYVIDAIFNNTNTESVSTIVLVWREVSKDFRLYWHTISDPALLIDADETVRIAARWGNKLPLSVGKALWPSWFELKNPLNPNEGTHDE